MIKKCKFTKIFGICLSLTLAFGVMQGCGTNKKANLTETEKQEDILAEMEEFTNPDQSVSIYLDKSWVTKDFGMEDVGITGWICAGSTSDDEVAILMQFPKSSAILSRINGWDYCRAIYDDLMTREDNPYAVDYNTTLEKTW